MPNILLLAAAALTLIGIQVGTRYFRAWRLRHWFQRGMALYKDGQHAEALAAFRKCVRIAPEWLHARTLMSISLAQTGSRDEALREIELVEALQPREGETWTLIATFFALCMPDDEERLFGALEKLAELDAKAARAIIDQPPLRRYNGTPRLRALRERLEVSV